VLPPATTALDATSRSPSFEERPRGSAVDVVGAGVTAAHRLADLLLTVNSWLRTATIASISP
jgi:hypothetical protein